jgi:hypothetical protein
VLPYSSNENKMSDGGRDRASLGVKVWKSSQKVERTAVRRSLHRMVRPSRLLPCGELILKNFSSAQKKSSNLNLAAENPLLCGRPVIRAVADLLIAEEQHG